MSALAIMLSAALLAGSAPAGVSGETRTVLDFSGEWEGTYRGGEVAFSARLARGTLSLHVAKGHVHSVPIRLVDDGDGRIRVGLRGRELVIGTYRLRRGCVIIVFPDNTLLALRRVKPHK